MTPFEVWAEVQASAGFQEITRAPTIRRFAGRFYEEEAAIECARKAKERPEVLGVAIEREEE